MSGHWSLRLLLINRGIADLLLCTSEIINQLFFSDKILHLESDCRKSISVAVLQFLIRILLEFQRYP